ncbi:MAG: hypothetical protein ACI8Q1_000144 [Parvicella sp.]
MFLKNSLSTNAEELSDGMNKGLIALDFKNEALEYCGAKRPLIIFTEDGTLSQIPEIKNGLKSLVLATNMNI